MIFNQIFDNVALAFKIPHFGILLELFRNLQLFAQRWQYKLAMRPIIKLSTNVIFD